MPVETYIGNVMCVCVFYILHVKEMVTSMELTINNCNDVIRGLRYDLVYQSVCALHGEGLVTPSTSHAFTRQAIYI